MNIGKAKKGHSKSSALSLPDNTKPHGILRNTLRGYWISLAIGSVLTLILSAVVYSLADPNRYITPVAFCILYISALLGGFLSAKFNGGSALLCGGLYAVMMLVTMFLVSLFFDGSYSADRSLPLAVGLRGVAAGLSIAGAMIGAHKPRTAKKRKSKRK